MATPDADSPHPAPDTPLPAGLGWRGAYGVVLGFLLLQIVIYAVVTRVFG